MNKEMIESTIFGIENDDGKKVIHYYGYGYYCDGDDEKPYRFLEYTFFYGNLQEVLEIGISEYEGEYSDAVKQYITDCTEEELGDIYEHYDEGVPPIPIHESEISLDIPCGVYVLVKI